MKKLDLSIFPQVDKVTWENLAQKQLKGDNPNEALKWQSSDDFFLSPYYGASDLKGLEDQIDFFQLLPSHQWKLYEEVKIISEKDANKRAINALMGGCDGIIFNLKESINQDELLHNINDEICNLSFIQKNKHQDFVTNVKVEMTNQNCHFEQVKTATPVEQLTSFVSTINNHKFIHRTAFADFFLEIATVRALRFLLNTKLNKSETKIHTHVPSQSEKNQQWFLNTTAGLASILGGSHSVSFSTSIGDERISRNVGNLIREESGISMYQNQCGGSYYIEVLTKKLIEETLQKSNL